MTTINLLPWREEFRAEKRKEFLTLLGVVAVSALIILVVWDRLANARIDWQESRNQLLETEIKVLDKQVAEIKELKRRRQEMIDRIEVIQNLQVERPETVKLFDSLVRAIPDGLYLSKMQKNGTGVSLSGFSESNNRVSSLMRSLDGSTKFKDSNLTRVVADNLLGEDGSKFEMKANVRKVAGSEDKGEATDG